jgi:hypothetical protein
MEEDKKQHPNCQYSIASSSSTSYTNGKKKSETSNVIMRLCPDPKENATIYDSSGDSAEPLSMGKPPAEFRDYAGMAEKFFGEQQSAMERMRKGGEGSAPFMGPGPSRSPSSQPKPFKPRYKGHTPSETVVGEAEDV